MPHRVAKFRENPPRDVEKSVDGKKDKTTRVKYRPNSLPLSLERYTANANDCNKAASPTHTDGSIVFARLRQCAPHLVYHNRHTHAPYRFCCLLSLFKYCGVSVSNAAHASQSPQSNTPRAVAVRDVSLSQLAPRVHQFANCHRARPAAAVRYRT